MKLWLCPAIQKTITERMAATAAATTKFELYILTRRETSKCKTPKLLNYAPSNKIFTTTPSSAPFLYFCRTKSKPTFNLETIDYQQFLLIYFFSFSFIRFIYFAYNNSKVFIKIYYPNQTNDRKTPNS